MLFFTALEHAKPGALVLIDDLDVRATTRFCQRLFRDNPQMLYFVSIPIDHVLGLFQKKSMGHLNLSAFGARNSQDFQLRRLEASLNCRCASCAQV